MDIEPRSEPGPELAAYRRDLGVSQADLARRLGVHRVTLNGWEGQATVDAVKAGRYRIAVRALAAEAIADGSAATA